ncbi:Serine/threonine-protein kinase CTR1 [Pelomyxa schiedti]|nr:Serine/threonine-protein kinase CTR1 [Pelomyxa schiedti]
MASSSGGYLGSNGSSSGYYNGSGMKTGPLCEWCGKMLQASLKTANGSYIYLSALIVSLMLFVEMAILLLLVNWRFRRELDSPTMSRKITLLPIYYYAILVCSLFALVEAVFIAAPLQPESKDVILSILSAIQSGLLDTWAIFFLMHPVSAPRRRIAIVTTVLSACSFALRLFFNLFTYFREINTSDESSTECGLCTFYIHDSTTSGWLIAIYFLLMVIAVLDSKLHFFSRLKLPICFRPATQIWGIYMIVVLLFGLLAFTLDQCGICAYCLFEITIITYILLWAPAMYFTYARDTAYWLAKNPESIHHADLKEPLLGETSSKVLEELLEKNNIPVINFSKVTLINKVGAGSYGEVWKGKWTGTSIAVKRLFGDEVQEDLLQEISILCQLRHPNIVLFMGVSVDVTKYCIVTEFVENGNLFTILHRETCPIFLDFNQRETILADSARGIAYLHGRTPPIMHRDLKSANVLITADLHAKLADFGLSKVFDSPGTTMTMVGTPQWAAPEVLRGETYSEKADVYAFGCIMWETYTNSIPFEKLTLVQVISLVGHKGLTIEIDPLCPRADLIKRCITGDSDLRPSIVDVLSDMTDNPWPDPPVYPSRSTEPATPPPSPVSTTRRSPFSSGSGSLPPTVKMPSLSSQSKKFKSPMNFTTPPRQPSTTTPSVTGTATTTTTTTSTSATSPGHPTIVSSTTTTPANIPAPSPDSSSSLSSVESDSSPPLTPVLTKPGGFSVNS